MQQKETILVPPVPPQLHPQLEPLSTTVSCTMTNSEVPSTTFLPPPPSTFPTIPSALTLSSASSVPVVPPTAPVCLTASSAISVVEQYPVVLSPEIHTATADLPVVGQTVSSTLLPQSIVVPPVQMMIPMNTQETEQTTSEINDGSKGVGVLHWFQQTVQQSEFLSKMANKAKVC